MDTVNWFYRNGEPGSIGDAVVCAEVFENGPPVGSTGIVSEFDGRRVGVIFDNFTRGHSLSPPIYTGTGGWDLPPSCLLPARIIETDISALRALNVDTGTFMVDNNQVWRMTKLDSIDPLKSLLDARDRAAQEIYQQELTKLDTAIKRLRAKEKSLKAIPNLTLEDIAKGICVCLYGGHIAWVLPFDYNPVEITRDNVRKKLPAELVERFRQKVFILIVSNSEMRKTILLETVDGIFIQVRHFHSLTDRDCLGGYILNDVSTVSEATKVRDDIEKLFRVINCSSLGTRVFMGKDAHEIRGTDIPPNTSAWRQPIVEGAKVKVISGNNFPIANLGSVGVVHRTWGENIRVEFLFTDPSFDCKTRRHTRRTIARLDPNDLELQPSDTPLTKRAGINALVSTETISETNTSPR